MDFIKLLFPTGPFYLRVAALKNIQKLPDNSMRAAYLDGQIVEVPNGLWQTAVFMTTEQVWAELLA